MDERVKRKAVRKQILNHTSSVSCHTTASYFTQQPHKQSRRAAGNQALNKQLCHDSAMSLCLTGLPETGCKGKHHFLYCTAKGRISCRDGLGEYALRGVRVWLWKAPKSVKDLQRTSTRPFYLSKHIENQYLTLSVFLNVRLHHHSNFSQSWSLSRQDVVV